jgi:hypothetical protein
MLHQTTRVGQTLVGGREVTWASLDDGDEIKIGPHLIIADFLNLGEDPESESNT